MSTKHTATPWHTQTQTPQEECTHIATPARIAKMIYANVAAVESGRISWEQFRVVNAATWELASRGELCIIGSPASRRITAVHRALAKVQA